LILPMLREARATNTRVDDPDLIEMKMIDVVDDLTLHVFH